MIFTILIAGLITGSIIGVIYYNKGFCDGYWQGRDDL